MDSNYNLYTTTWIELKNGMVCGKKKIRYYIGYDSIYMKFPLRGNLPRQVLDQVLFRGWAGNEE